MLSLFIRLLALLKMAYFMHVHTVLLTFYGINPIVVCYLYENIKVIAHLHMNILE